MIRLFEVFCKLNFIKKSEKDLFLTTMESYSADKLPFLKLMCPYCGAKNPGWSHHGSYPRYLISFEKEVVTETIEVTRIMCSSCKHAHAILPEIIVPHNSFTLMFILKVLKDYFTKNLKIREICEKYQISPSVLYAWKRLFLIHKKLWLGILQDTISDDIATFLSSIITSNLSEDLSCFVSRIGWSFLEGITKTAHFSSA